MPAATMREFTPDELDDLFNYDAGLDETLRNAETLQSQIQDNPAPPPRPTANFDEEVKVTKKRQPVAKLDEERLLSRAGIPKLQKICKSMRYKGKGHEFSDMTRLLNTYQLWLDDLFPKAKFNDGLTMIEKLGHKKTIQMYRREWMQADKPEPIEEREEIDMTDSSVPTAATVAEDNRTTHHGERIERGSPNRPFAQSERPKTVPKQDTSQVEPEEDELDALLAESAPEESSRTSLFGSGNPTQNHRAVPPDRDDFADEEEAMAGMEF